MHDNKELVELLLERGASCKDQDKVSQSKNEATKTNGIEIKIERGIEVATIEIVS